MPDLQPAAPYGHCHWCKKTLLAPERCAKRSRTRDHVYPKSRGGRRTVPSCRHCNHLKGDLLPDQWAKAMAMFPNYWKAFHTHTDLRAAMAYSRRELLSPLRIARIQPRWPCDVLVTPPPICRGHPIPNGRGNSTPWRLT